MKYFVAIFIGIFIFSIPGVSSQKSCSCMKLDSLRIELLDSLRILNKKLENSKKEALIQKETLTEKLNNASNTIEYLNSMNSTFESVFTILGIFIAILTIIIPFATYQYAVKPSQDAIKALEKNFDDRLKKYLEDTRNKQIGVALDNIKSGNTELKNQGISYLTFTQNEGLTDDQLFKVYSILKKNPSDFAIKSQLAYILSSRKTEYSSELFNSIEVKDDPVIKQMAIIYYARIGYAENYDGIKQLFVNNEGQDINFITLVLNINQYSTADVIRVIGDPKVIDLLTKETLTKLKISFPSILQSLDKNIKYLGFADKVSLINI